jgi:CO/xanthine dehydrogenase FAD-binding subunit
VTIPALRHHRPATVRDACALGEYFGASGAFLAGGTELVADYQRGRGNALDLISLGGIDELRGIQVDDGTLRIGALTTVAELARSPIVEAWLPALPAAARALGSPQIRSRATIGGNFCGAVPCADLPPAVLVADATVRIASAAETRDVPAHEFFIGSRRTVLRSGELLLEVRIPKPPRQRGTHFARFGLRRGLALAVASVAVRVDVVDGRIADAAAALGAVGPTPLWVPEVSSALRGQLPSEVAYAHAAEICARAARPVSDIRGSAEHRRAVVVVLARRAFARAAALAATESTAS